MAVAHTQNDTPRRMAGGAGGPDPTHSKIWVPHLRDSLIVAKVGSLPIVT